VAAAVGRRPERTSVLALPSLPFTGGHRGPGLTLHPTNCAADLPRPHSPRGLGRGDSAVRLLRRPGARARGIRRDLVPRETFFGTSISLICLPLPPLPPLLLGDEDGDERGEAGRRRTLLYWAAASACPSSPNTTPTHTWPPGQLPAHSRPLTPGPICGLHALLLRGGWNRLTPGQTLSEQSLSDGSFGRRGERGGEGRASLPFVRAVRTVAPEQVAVGGEVARGL